MELSEKTSSFYKVYILSAIIVSVSLLLSSVTSNYALNITAAVILAVLAIAVYFLGKKNNSLRILNPILNSAAIGVAIGALYSYKKISLQFTDVLVGMLILILLFSLNSLISQHLEAYKRQVFINILLGIVVLVFCITKGGLNSGLYIQGIFLSIYYIFAFIALLLLVKKGDLWYSLSMMFFSTFIIIVVLVIVIISESGDGLEALFDFADVGSERNKKNKRI